MRPGLAVAFSNLGHCYTHLVTILYATAVLHLPGVFDLPYGELLALSSLGLILFGVGALPAGWLADRWSQVGMMVVFFFGIGLGTIVTGLADKSRWLFIGLTLIGLLASIYHPVGIAWLVAIARKQGMTLGINGMFGAAGSALAPVFVGMMIDADSWRAAFIVPGLLSMATGTALLVAWWRGWVTGEKADRIAQAPPDPAAFRRVFIVLTVTMACNGFVFTGLTTTMPKLFAMGLGPVLASSYTEIGLYVGAVLGLSSLSSLFGGWLADRYSARNIYIVFWFLLAPPLFVMTSGLGYTLLTIAFMAMLFNVAFAAAENMLVARYTPFEWRALAYGAKFVLALGVGGLTVLLAGELFDRTGSFDLLYALLGLSAIVAGVGALLLPRARPALFAPAAT